MEWHELHDNLRRLAALRAEKKLSRQVERLTNVLARAGVIPAVQAQIRSDS